MITFGTKKEWITKSARKLADDTFRRAKILSLRRKARKWMPVDGRLEDDLSVNKVIKINAKELEKYYFDYYQAQQKNERLEFRLKLLFSRLLANIARAIDWSLVPHLTQAKEIRPSATFLDMLNYPVGYLEAISGDKDFYTEIKGKIEWGFPLTNTIFENTEKAVLYQENKFLLEAKLGSREIEPLLSRFFGYQPPDMDIFTELSKDVKLTSTVQYNASRLLIPNTSLILKHQDIFRPSPSFTSPSFSLLKKLLDGHIRLNSLHWRDFEELVAALLNEDGYLVKLGPGRNDGGADIIATKEMEGHGLFMSVWQAKRLEDGNKVALRTIRELADTRNQYKASKGIIVTSTFLTRGALDRIKQDKYILGKVDRNDLQEWIERVAQRARR